VRVDQLDQQARLAQNLKMTRTINLYEAETQLSALVEAAASGEEIVIAENGVAKARLVPLPITVPRRIPTGLLDITYIAEDFDAPDPEIEALFEGKS
jgi:antitoxin (DNA-binding transcriptional repressor) of toxin-antitoxin stability system